MKKILWVVFLVLISSNCFAETGPNRNITNIYSTTDSATITIPGAALECSKVFSTKFVNSANDDIVFFIQATSASGTPNITYYFEEAVQDTTTSSLGTEDSAYLITDTLASSQTTENLIVATAETVNGTFARIRIQGGSTNPGDTQVTIKMVK